MKANPGDAIGKIANDLIHRDKFKRPIIMCAVAANGSMFAGEYPRGRLPVSVEFLDRPVGGKMVMPLNVFYVDANGRAARAIMDEGGVQISIDEPAPAARKRRVPKATPSKLG